MVLNINNRNDIINTLLTEELCMQPSLVKINNSTEKKINAWIHGINKTGYLRTSAVPDLTKGLSTQKDQSICVEAIDFNNQLSEDRLKQMVDLNCLKLDKNIAIIDFNQQKIEIGFLKTFLQWIESEKSDIRQINLANLANCSKSWRYFIDWVIKTNCVIKSIDLGETVMNLSRTKDIITLIQNSAIQVSRIDFGSSHWKFGEMKAFLWMGGLSSSVQLTRLALGDSKMCADSIRLLIDHLCTQASLIQVFSSGVVELGNDELTKLAKHLMSRQSNIISCVLSNQVFDQDRSLLLAKVVSRSESIRHLALINCWIDHEKFESSLVSGRIENIYLETITAGQIHHMTDCFTQKGYHVDQKISRHRVRLKLRSDGNQLNEKKQTAQASVSS